MKRLINPDELKSDILSKMYLAQKEYLHKSHIVYQIDIAPTVDAVEVVHGSMRHVFFSYQSNHYECTCCEATFLTNMAPHWNYCPNCGAKMDVERKNDD